MSVWNGRAPGANRFGWPSWRVKHAPRFWAAMPVSGSRMPEPKPQNRLWISETALPSASAVTRAIVSPSGRRVAAAPSRAWSASPARCPSSTSVDGWTSMRSGSARCRSRSPLATSITRAMRPASAPVEVRVDAEALEQREDLQQDEPLRVRWDHADVQIAEGATHRREHARLVRREILDRDRRTGGGEPGRVGLAHDAAVQRRGAFVGDRAKRPGERGLRDDVAHRRRCARRVEDRREPGVIGERCVRIVE